HLGLAVLAVNLLEVLEPYAEVAGLRVDLRARPHELIVGIGVLLLPPLLVRRRHGLLEAGEDRLERDPLLAFELAERRDHLLIHVLLLFSSSAQSGEVRADAIPSYGTRSSPPADARTIASASAETSAPSCTFELPSGSTVLIRTRSPTNRRNSSGPRRDRSSPGELTSSA